MRSGRWLLVAGATACVAGCSAEPRTTLFENDGGASGLPPDFGGDGEDDEDDEDGEDGEPPPVEMGCNPWTQNCPGGWKCHPILDLISVTGICLEVDPGAIPAGESCVADLSFQTDPCERGAVCISKDPDRPTIGTCRRLCGGDSITQHCDDTAEFCLPNADFGVCREPCHPLVSDCDPGYACLPTDPNGPVPYGPFACFDIHDEVRLLGDSCENSQRCTEGLVCVPASQVPGCVPEADGCCSAICVVSSGRACFGGQTCVPAFAPDQAPPDLADVGICALI